MNKTTINIVEIATQKFAQIGIRNVSIDDICNELRISKKTFYKYFPQKENLIESVLKYRAQFNSEKFGKIYADKNAIDALILIIKEIKKNAEIEHHVFYYELEKYYPELYAKYVNIKCLKIKESFEKNLKQGIEEGYYREDLDIEMISMFHSVQMKDSFEKMNTFYPKIPKKRLVEFFVDLIIRLITNEKGYDYIQNKLNKDLTQEEK